MNQPAGRFLIWDDTRGDLHGGSAFQAPCKPPGEAARVGAPEPGRRASNECPQGVLGQDACRTEPLEIAAQDRELPTDVYATKGSEPRMSTAG